MRIGFVYTQLYQQASGGPGDRWGMSGDADLMFDWTLVGRGTKDTGRFFFSVEDRFRFIAPVTPAELSGEIGSLVNTGVPFDDRGLVIRDAFWDQRFLDARLRILAGRAPDDYVGSHRLGSGNFAFLNASVGGNPTMAFVGHGPMALVSVHPNDTVLCHRRRRQRLQHHDGVYDRRALRRGTDLRVRRGRCDAGDRALGADAMPSPPGTCPRVNSTACPAIGDSPSPLSSTSPTTCGFTEGTDMQTKASSLASKAHGLSPSRSTVFSAAPTTSPVSGLATLSRPTTAFEIRNRSRLFIASSSPTHAVQRWRPGYLRSEQCAR